jgi:hypothetical protein
MAGLQMLLLLLHLQQVLLQARQQAQLQLQQLQRHLLQQLPPAVLLLQQLQELAAAAGGDLRLEVPAACCWRLLLQQLLRQHCW